VPGCWKTPLSVGNVMSHNVSGVTGEFSERRRYLSLDQFVNGLKSYRKKAADSQISSSKN
jgi:hypothetical protein